MQFKTITLDQATDDQLRENAEMLGVEVNAADSREAVISKIRVVTPNVTAIRVPETPITLPPADAPAVFATVEDAPLAPPTAAEQHAADARGDPQVKLIVQNEERDGVITSTDVGVGVNGKVWQIKRGVPVLVPYRVFKALGDAIRTVVTMDLDTGEMLEAEALAYPFNTLQTPSDAEIAAWHKRVDHIEIQ